MSDVAKKVTKMRDDVLASLTERDVFPAESHPAADPLCRELTFSLRVEEESDSFIVRCAENGLVATDPDEQAALGKMFKLLSRQTQFALKRGRLDEAAANDDLCVHCLEAREDHAPDGLSYYKGEHVKQHYFAAYPICHHADYAKGWISVEERLPEMRHSHETRNRHGKLEFTFETSDLVMTFNPNGLDGKSSIQTRFHIQRRISYVKGDKWVHAGVTHWMPLPEPPK